MVSTHSRPKAADCCKKDTTPQDDVSTHSRPKAAEDAVTPSPISISGFQHTAARRRLTASTSRHIVAGLVSTHSRPKAADATKARQKSQQLFQHTAARRRLNTRERIPLFNKAFQHTAARRRLKKLLPHHNLQTRFQHTAARRRLIMLTN